ncbi:MAG: hypothetical protein E6G62_09450 [Actinobacteria bacterium]|nr:MAG: hypothetical protein E6G62_09450 [Actinomycetota bacterium]
MITKTQAPATTTPAATHRTATTATTAKAAAPTHRAPVHKVVHAAKLPIIGKNGLPTMIDQALESHRIVVVALFDAQSATDAISAKEARRGAADAGVGFVGINLLDSPLAAALTSALPGGGLLPAPGVLIYRRPGILVERLDGFTDKDVVAQAAAASVTAPPLTGA